MNCSSLPSESHVMSPMTAWLTGRSFEPMNRHHREELLDRPAVGNRLEQREVAEIGVRQQLVERLQVFRDFVHALGELVDLLADRPEQVFGVRALFERQVAAAEQVHGHVERLLRVVIGLERRALRDRVIGLDQVDQRLLELVLDRPWESFPRQSQSCPAR